PWDDRRMLHLFFVVLGLSPAASSEVDVLEQVVRFAVRSTPPKPCTNYGSTQARCLFLAGRKDPPAELMARLTDLQPPILSLSECRNREIVGETLVATDPYIELPSDVTWTDADHATTTVYSSGLTTRPFVCRDKGVWHVSGGGWDVEILLPGDCQ